MPPRGAPQMMMPGQPGMAQVMMPMYGMMRPGMPPQGYVAVAPRAYPPYAQGGYMQMPASGMMMQAGMANGGAGALGCRAVRLTDGGWPRRRTPPRRPRRFERC